MLKLYGELALQHLEKVLRRFPAEPFDSASEGQYLAIIPNDLSGRGVHIGPNQKLLHNDVNLEHQLDFLQVRFVEDIGKEFAVEVSRCPGAPTISSSLRC